MCGWRPASIGERALIGIGAVVAAGTIIEDEVMLAAGAVTLPGQTLESGWLWGGGPRARCRGSTMPSAG